MNDQGGEACGCGWDGGLRKYCDAHNPCFGVQRSEPMIRTKTWSDIEIAALNDPVLQAAVAVVNLGMSREQALINAVLTLSEIRKMQNEQLLEIIMRLPAKPIAPTDTGGLTKKGL